MFSEPNLQLRFDPSEDSAVHWAARAQVEHGLSLRKLETLYARALPYLKVYAYELATKYGWNDEPIDAIGETQVAVCLGRDEQLPLDEAPHVSRLVLPLHFEAFLDPTLAQDWRAMFSNLLTNPSTSSPNPTDIFQLARAGIAQPIQNIIYLLQALSPGLLVLRSFEDDDGEWDPQGTDRGLPPSLWVGLNIESLEDIFGAPTAIAIYQAAEDPYCAMEDATTDGDSGTFESFDSLSDSSSASYSEEDWASSWGDVEQDDDEIFLQIENDDVHLEVTAAGVAATNTFGKTDYFATSKPLAKNPTYNDDDPMMDYRHCDAECAFCGRCDARFAQQLTERLLLTGVAM